MSHIEDFERRYGDPYALSLEPLSVHAGDTEGAHPDSCWCSVCAERERRREIEDTFNPWHKDPRQIARLLRWLSLVDEVPPDIPAFLENAGSWGRQWREMREAERGQ